MNAELAAADTPSPSHTRWKEAPWKIAILGGGGAMGGLYGAWLAKGGHEVHLLDISKAAVDAINRQGLTLEHFDGSTETLHLPAATDAGRVGLVDLVLVEVKGRHTQSAAEGARPLVGDNTVVLTLQNGWGNAQKLAAILGADQVVSGISLHSGELLAPGHIRHSGVGGTTIGEANGKVTARMHALARVLAPTGKVNLSPNVLKEIWTKLALNCSCLPSCALLRFRSGLMLELRNTTALMQAAMREAVAVAAAEGIPLTYEETWRHLEEVVGEARQTRASMLQDVEHGRLSEIDTINGALVEAAEKHHIPVPVNQTLVWLVRAYDEELLRGASASAAVAAPGHPRSDPPRLPVPAS